jgi:hypothetical protein
MSLKAALIVTTVRTCVYELSLFGWGGMKINHGTYPRGWVGIAQSV